MLRRCTGGAGEAQGVCKVPAPSRSLVRAATRQTRELQPQVIDGVSENKDLVHGAVWAGLDQH